MVLERKRRSALGITVLLMLSMKILMYTPQGTQRHPRHTSEYTLFWTQSLPLEGGRYKGRHLPFLVFPVEKERLINACLLEETLSLTTKRHRVAHQAYAAETFGTVPLHYIHRASPPLPFKTFNSVDEWTSRGTHISSIGQYFKYLQTPQTSCKKLVRMGGTLDCETNAMDGHKYLCFDPPLGLVSSKDPQRCLTLSFGVQYDTTFDDAVADLPCELHMFDVLNFNPPLVKERENMYFHNKGLAGSVRTNFFNNINLKVKMGSLRSHVEELGLRGRLIHVLKVDIENAEWDAFKNIASDPLFDAVGQVAMEVHQTELVTGPMKHSPPAVPRDRWLDALQSRYDVLRMIEARGFRRVLYWDNVQDDFPLVDDHGVRYETSGELLYINTNWFNATFRKELQRRGFGP
ncbi:uncharacterized protein LOC135111314 [Scylla paramamosain]|uniref:uncharacterized protein LOC135111314 n=1 Tax=Scylla paramamosain TaxID=85552 RepID=UPI0030836F61